MTKHNKILLLIIGLALLIALFSKPEHQAENKTPWNIQQLPDGRIYVFGITPGKTTIQEANQILGHFADIRLYNTEPPQLLATHESMLLGDDLARIDLQYAIDDVELADMQQSSTVFSPCQYTKPAMEQEIALLNSPIARIIFTPVANYTVNSVNRQLGDADEIIPVNDKQEILRYKKLNLTIYINNDKPDVFIYDDVTP